MTTAGEAVQPFDRRRCNSQSFDFLLQQSNQKEYGTPGLRLLEFNLLQNSIKGKEKQQTDPTPTAATVRHHSPSTTTNPSPILQSSPDTTSTQTPVSAPHIILPVASLMEKVNEHLGLCSDCTKCKLKLDYDKKIGVASKLTLTCDHCNNMMKQVELRLKNLERARRNADRRLAKKRHRANGLRYEIRYLREKLQRLKNQIKQRHIQPMITNNTYEQNPSNNVPMTNYDINLRTMFAAYHCGTGSLDVVKMLSMLGCNINLNFERSFSRNMPFIHKKILDCSNRIIDRALREEIEATIDETFEEGDESSEKQTIYNEIMRTKNGEMNTNNPVKLTVSYDMGWSKRSTGKVYDSLSGHGYLVGTRTGKVVRMGVLSKKCSICSAHNRTNNTAVPPHSCMINHDGSSGSMEAKLGVMMLEGICDEYKGGAFCEAIVSDDDSKLRSKLRHVTNGGVLKESTPEPRFYCDPSHRTKVMVKKVFALVKNRKGNNHIKKIDALRLKKYFSCYIAQSREKSIDEFIKNIKAPVEHLFDCHEFCDASWCWTKSIDKKMFHYMKQKRNEMVRTNNYSNI